jgi:hypothetical protein
MKLQEIFDHLSAGEFSQISIGGQPSGVINEDNWERVLSHLNLGLTALYTRFKLKERDLEIPLQADANIYQLDVYDILKIEEIKASSGEIVPLNDKNNPFSCHTTSLNTLKVPTLLLVPDSSVPDKLRTSTLTVTYRANHPKIMARFGMLNPTTKVIELPYSHLSALLYYMASRVNNPIGMSSEFNAGNTWYAKYEAECLRLEEEGAEVDTNNTNQRLVRNGWV